MDIPQKRIVSGRAFDEDARLDASVLDTGVEARDPRAERLDGHARGIGLARIDVDGDTVCRGHRQSWGGPRHAGEIAYEIVAPRRSRGGQRSARLVHARHERRLQRTVGPAVVQLRPEHEHSPGRRPFLDQRGGAGSLRTAALRPANGDTTVAIAPHGLSHLSLAVADPERSLRFYERFLGVRE